MMRRKPAKSSGTFQVEAPAALPRWQRWLRLALYLTILAAGSGATVLVALYLYFAPTLPDFRSIDDYQPIIGSRIFSADNQLIGEFAAERRVLVPYERIPPQLFNAFMAAEDKRFYSHMGIDPLGMMQAVADKILHPSRKLRGASTLSQQAAKSLLATHESYESATERSIVRKIREAILALRLEQQLSKHDILYMYANQVFLGHRAYGVQAAAEHYFRKNVWELSLAEMATLAGLPQRPSDYDPFRRPKSAAARRKYVLGRMLTDGYITPAEHDAALQEKLVVYPRYELYLEAAPYYTEQVRRAVVDRYGEKALTEDGLQIYTAVHPDLQHFAQSALNQTLKELDKRQGYREPLAHLDAELVPLFKRRYRVELGLADGEVLEPKKGERYLGLVTGYVGSGSKASVKLDIGGVEGLLPLAGMRWARTPNPVVRWDFGAIEDVRRVLKPGDVVAVIHTTSAWLKRSFYGAAVAGGVPDDTDKPLFRLDQEPIAQAAVLSVDLETGYVVAQVGGYNFEDSAFNRATQACREPGSAIKPVVYSAAIDKLDYTPSTLIDDKPMVYDDEEAESRWKPGNSGQEFRGEIPLRTCLKDSINTAAIRIAEAVGIDDVIKNARNLGVHTPMKRELGSALGSSCTTLSELSNAYVALGRYGSRKDMIFIRRVVDRYGNVLEDNSAPTDPTLSLLTRLDRAYAELVTPEQRALDAQTAFITVSLMTNVVREGTGAGASGLGLNVAGKTGTTNDSYDAWFMAFTPKVMTGVWVGHDKKERPLGIAEQGGRTALPLWVDYMDQAARDYTLDEPKRLSHGNFRPPSGVTAIEIDPETGLRARPGASRKVVEWYRTGTEPESFTPDPAHPSPTDSDIWVDVDEG